MSLVPRDMSDGARESDARLGRRPTSSADVRRLTGEVRGCTVGELEVACCIVGRGSFGCRVPGVRPLASTSHCIC